MVKNWDRDRDGPGVIRHGAIAEAIEALSVEDFCKLVVALSRRERERERDGTKADDGRGA